MTHETQKPLSLPDTQKQTQVCCAQHTPLRCLPTWVTDTLPAGSLWNGTHFERHPMHFILNPSIRQAMVATAMSLGDSCQLSPLPPHPPPKSATTTEESIGQSVPAACERANGKLISTATSHVGFPQPSVCQSPLSPPQQAPAHTTQTTGSREHTCGSGGGG